MKKSYLHVKDIHIHYRSTGKGPLLFLFHPSPLSSAAMTGFMELLKDHFHVIAWDLPGYGNSDALLKPPDSMYDYVPYLSEFIQHFSSQPVLLYGTATGAQLAIAYGIICSQQVKHLYIDNAAHFEDEECDEIIKQYFPDLSPKTDGSHLQKIWDIVTASSLYFPWYFKDEAHRFSNQLPSPQQLQKTVNEYLLAGADYALAYKAAFLHERAERVQQLKIPVTIFKWMGSPLLKYIEKLLLYKLPANVQVVETPLPMNERYAVMKKIFTG